MKKKLLSFMLCILVLCGIIISYIPITGDFALEDYASKIQSFPGNQSFGNVSSAHQAINIAKTVWNTQYPDGAYGPPYRAFYDDINHAWLVYASTGLILPSGPYILLSEKDGLVLAIWNEKF